MRRPILGPLLLRRAVQLGLALLLLLVLSELVLRQLDRRGYVALDAPGRAVQRLFVAVGDSYLATNPVDYSESEFPVVKPPGVWRMFILGDSFVQSFPYQYECSMADWMDQGL